MQRLVRLLLFAAACLDLATPVSAATARAPDTLILISIDGFRSDYMTHGKTPVLAALAGQGVQAPMRPSYPSQTFPNHYTLVTGLRPDHHGIVDNTMEDPVLGRFTMANSADPRWWNEAEPFWITADRQGLKTASMFWVGSDRTIRGATPDYWKPYDQTIPADARVDQVLAWVDLPKDQRPTFITLYFDIVDTEGHRHGPYSQELDQALASTDTSVGRLVDGLKARGLYAHANLIVVADHGMAATSAERVIYLDDVAGGAEAIHAVNVGTGVGLSVTPQAPKDTLQRLLAPHDHMVCRRKADLPKRLHYGTNARVPPVVCLAEVGWYLSTHHRMAKTKDFNVGNHGYDPDAPEMAALFIAEGPGFKPGRTLPAFDNVDVQPLMARLLRVKAPKADGSAKVFDGVLRAH